jgi:photosystem II stability/assembly factor-like uncharacterized protein
MRLLILLLLVSAAAPEEWLVLTSGIESNLRAVSVATTTAGGTSMWASGSNGVILRSLDTGKSWQRLQVEGAEKLDFRGLRALNADTAYALSAGPGEQSRIYKTTNGGKTWSKQYQGARQEIFLDGLVCRDLEQCFAVGDPVDGKFLFLSTTDGERWEERARETMPAALKEEGAFAASNSSLALCGENTLVFGTGGPAARLFYSGDMGQSWTVYPTPILSGPASAGIFSVACWDNTVVAVGGDYKNPDAAEKVAAYSLNRGKSWQLAAQLPGGFRSSVVRMQDGSLLTVGTNGTDRSTDGGVHWTRCSSLNLNALAADRRNVWGAGPKGTLALFLSPITARQ